MPAKIRDVLDLPIRKGFMDWLKTERTIFAILETVGGDFTKVKDNATGNFIDMKTEDAIVLKFEAFDDKNISCGRFGVKLFKPRFVAGNLVCQGFCSGTCNELNEVIFDAKTLRVF